MTLDDYQANLSAKDQQIGLLQAELSSSQKQLEWLKKQLFGQRSERRPEVSPDQLSLFQSELNKAGLEPPEEKTNIPAHTRKKRRTGDEVNDTGLRFDDNVPVEEIILSCPELEGPNADQYELIGYKDTFKLGSRPGSSVVIKYRRAVVKHKGDETITQTPAPQGVLGQAQVDVSFIAHMLVEKFVYHAPLYRQHQKLESLGITLSRSSLTHYCHQSISLLVPIAQAVLDGILAGGHAKLDETPVKAGRGKTKAGEGKMNTGWFWPILGEQGDIAFHYNASRGKKVVEQLLGGRFKGVLQTDGYEVYASYARQCKDIIHALCWSHTRRYFINAEKSEPYEIGMILILFKVLYRIEAQLKEKNADPAQILAVRSARSTRCVDRIFRWIKAQIQRPDLLPKDPFTKALNYALEREAGLLEMNI